ncbi:MAG: Na+/H+ antiporter NhaC family protein [Gammaproteobacteria bacterium]
MTGTWISILPPLVAIGFALAFRQVIVALFAGLWLGAFFVNGGDFSAAWTGLLDTMAVYLREALADADHVAIILFSLMIGGMVGIISRNGGMLGIVDRVAGWTSSPRRGQLAAAGLGLGVFFDDYANTLVVGNTMRPVTDRLRVSREKLAYLVDSTAAPVASIALVTTWIGMQVGLIGDAVGKIDGYDESAYSVFIHSLAYSFYPLLALAFVFAVAWSGRDFGPMLTAERAARRDGVQAQAGKRNLRLAAELDAMTPDDATPRRARNALLPIVTLVVATLGGLWITGSAEAGADAGLQDIIGSADSYRALLWGSLLCVVVAFAMSVGQRLMTMEEVVDAWFSGVKSVFPAMVILTLAWGLSAVCGALDTAAFLTGALGDTVHPGVLPTLVFVLAAITAFATGTSWGTMGILMPLVVPLAWAIGGAEGAVLYASIASVLAGAVWGDHCSPLSDTTILSSMASGCDHIAHVRTQLPYALLVGAAAIVVGLLPVGFGVPWWLSLPVGVVVLVATLRLIGRRVD